MAAAVTLAERLGLPEDASPEEICGRLRLLLRDGQMWAEAQASADLANGVAP